MHTKIEFLLFEKYFDFISLETYRECGKLMQICTQNRVEILCMSPHLRFKYLSCDLHAFRCELMCEV